ncbi:CrcB family protein [Candidatus Peregrinibacteria bacterium]|nr:CrcB family protein [Candidatus Peregrinibacteria bacterium]
MKFAYMGAFGLFGIFARYFLGLFVSRYFTTPFPYASFFINIMGSFFVGVVYVLGTEKAILNPEMRIAIMVGLLGGFTTFSAYSLETARLIEDARFWLAGLNFCLSPIAGVLSALGGLHLTRLLMSRGAS